MAILVAHLASTCYAGNRPSRGDEVIAQAIEICRACADELPDIGDYKFRLAALEKLQAEHAPRQSPKGDERRPEVLHTIDSLRMSATTLFVKSQIESGDPRAAEKLLP